MKKFVYGGLIAAVFATLLGAVLAYGESPYPPWVKKLVASDLGDAKLVNGHYLEKVAVINFDPAAIAALRDVGAHPMGVYLPAGAMVTQSWFSVQTQFVDSGSGTLAWHCEDANNLYTATDVTGITTATTTGASTGAASTMVKAIAARCQITATVGGVALTDGKMRFYVRYLLGN